MQILEPPRTESYSTEDGHFIKTFLISTKQNQAGWQVSKDTLKTQINKFIGKDFIIAPELINKPLALGGGGHYFGTDTLPDLIQGYHNHSHGIIESVSGPFEYDDDSDDYFYMANIKLRDSKAAGALMEHGSRTWVPFAVSPHIWPTKQSSCGLILEFDPIGSALVIQGAYGKDAVVDKYCKGDQHSCIKSLGASSLAGGFPKQEPVPLNTDQLNDLHAAIRVKTEDNMEAEISNFLYRKGPLDNPIERLQSETPDYVTRSQSSTDFAKRSIQGDSAKPYLSEVLANSQTGGPPHREFDPDTGNELIVRDPPLRDQYMAIVNKDLNDQYIALDSKNENYFDKSTVLSNAMNYRENQVNAECDAVVDEIQGDINNEAIDLNNEGQLISERFGWESASEKMAAGEYGQTNGGIRGITDSSLNTDSGGGGGECCIFNQYGGGGCGSCSGSVVPFINETVSSLVLKNDKIEHIWQLIQLQKMSKIINLCSQIKQNN